MSRKWLIYAGGAGPTGTTYYQTIAVTSKSTVAIESKEVEKKIAITSSSSVSFLKKVTFSFGVTSKSVVAVLKKLFQPIGVTSKSVITIATVYIPQGLFKVAIHVISSSKVSYTKFITTGFKIKSTSMITLGPKRILKTLAVITRSTIVFTQIQRFVHVLISIITKSLASFSMSKIGYIPTLNTVYINRLNFGNVVINNITQNMGNIVFPGSFPYFGNTIFVDIRNLLDKSSFSSVGVISATLFVGTTQVPLYPQGTPGTWTGQLQQFLKGNYDVYVQLYTGTNYIVSSKFRLTLNPL